MKVKLIAAVIALLCVKGFSQTTYVPDDNFEQALIDLGLDDELDDYVLTENINTVTSLSVYSQGIDDLTGIEDFTALTYLLCEDNNLTELDLSENLLLEDLLCAYNELEELDLSSNLALQNLSCENNHLSVLNIESNASLKILNCSYNLLMSLDVSANTGLTILGCYENGLSTLDVSSNLMLENLICWENNIEELDVSMLANLKLISCSYNEIKELDLSNNTQLELIFCDNNELESLNVKNGNNHVIDFTGFNCEVNPDLHCVEVDDVAYSYSNWFSRDAQTEFNESCGMASINEGSETQNIVVTVDQLNNSFVVKLNNANADFHVYNISGELLTVGKLVKGVNYISMNEYAKGIYFLKTSSGGEILTHKLTLN